MDSENTKRSAYFGFRDVSEQEKASLVEDVFRSVAARYDLMNDVMSLGVHRLWKDLAVGRSGVRRGQTVLDVAAGSCDLTHRFVERVGHEGRVVAVDVSRPMLQLGRSRMIDSGNVTNISYVLSDAENLAFSDQQFDCVSIGFGLRNVTRIQSALGSMFRMLRPGGRIVVLEFSQPSSKFLSYLYDLYSFAVIPKIGRAVTGDEGSYQYLVESIRQHPNQESLRKMMCKAGFEDVYYHNLSGGVVALHVGFRY
jgi:demethylmenaquinone methyltransferase/2-methoxy-6-polyprenyl-1,4-benzoquinol methylase